MLFLFCLDSVFLHKSAESQSCNIVCKVAAAWLVKKLIMCLSQTVVEERLLIRQTKCDVLKWLIMEPYASYWLVVSVDSWNCSLSA